MDFIQLALLAFIIQSLIEIVEITFFKETINWKNIAGFALGGLFSVIYKIDILVAVGLPAVGVAWLSYIVNFIVVGAAMTNGAGILHDLFKKVKPREE